MNTRLQIYGGGVTDCYFLTNFSGSNNIQYSDLSSFSEEEDDNSFKGRGSVSFFIK